MLKKIFLFILFTLTLKAQTTDVTLLLSWKNQFQFAGYYMAKEMGYYEESGLNVDIKEYTSNRNNAKDVASLKYEFAIKHSSLILDKLNKYPNLKFLAAIHQSSPLVLISKKSSNIKTLQDIKNQLIMFNPEDKASASINAMLYSKGISNYHTTKIQFDSDNFINSDVPCRIGYISNEPYELTKKGLQYTLFNPKDYGYDFYSDILFTSQEFINTNPQQVEAFYNASLKGWKYAYSHINETVAIILEKYNTQNKTKDALIFEANTLKDLAFVGDIKFGNLNPLKLKEITTTYRLLGLLKEYKYIDFHDFIYNLNKHTNQDMMKRLYSQYKPYIISIFTFLLITIIMIFYFRNRLKLKLKQQTQELKQNYKIFDENISSSRTDLAGNITYVTAAFCNVSGYTKEELIGQNHRVLKYHDSLSSSEYKELWLTIKSGHTWKGELKNINKDGSDYWADTVIAPIFDKNENIIGYEGIKEDITAKKALQEFNKNLEQKIETQTKKLRFNEKYLNTLFDVNPHIAYVLKNGELERVNKMFLEFTGFTSMEKFLEEHNCICEQFEQNKFTTKHTPNNCNCFKNSKVTLIRNNNKYVFTLSTQQFAIDNQERYLVVLEDITEIENLAITDKLTGLYNRTKTDTEVLLNFNYFKDYGDVFSLILLDIDLFKDVNDIHGHQVGDAVLKEIATLIKNSVRETDIVGRWGGEEFIVICSNTDVHGASLVAETIRKVVAEYQFPRVKNIHISAGVSDVSSHKDVHSLFEATDKALYKAKSLGRNRVEKHDA